MYSCCQLCRIAMNRTGQNILCSVSLVKKLGVFQRASRSKSLLKLAEIFFLMRFTRDPPNPLSVKRCRKGRQSSAISRSTELSTGLGARRSWITSQCLPHTGLVILCTYISTLPLNKVWKWHYKWGRSGLEKWSDKSKLAQLVSVRIRITVILDKPFNLHEVQFLHL